MIYVARKTIFRGEETMTMPGEKSRNHPELRRGEFFDGNVEPGSEEGTYRRVLDRRFRRLRRNERLGQQQAYDI